MRDGQRSDRVPVMVRMSVRGLVEIDVAAGVLGVTRSDVIRRAIRYGLPKVQQEAQFHAETDGVAL